MALGLPDPASQQQGAEDALPADGSRPVGPMSDTSWADFRDSPEGPPTSTDFHSRYNWPGPLPPRTSPGDLKQVEDQLQKSQRKLGSEPKAAQLRHGGRRPGEPGGRQWRAAGRTSTLPVANSHTRARPAESQFKLTRTLAAVQVPAWGCLCVEVDCEGVRSIRRRTRFESAAGCGERTAVSCSAISRPVSLQAGPGVLAVAAGSNWRRHHRLPRQARRSGGPTRLSAQTGLSNQVRPALQMAQRRQVRQLPGLRLPRLTSRSPLTPAASPLPGDRSSASACALRCM